MIELNIDPELKSLIPALTADERAGLEESLKTEGCRDPLVVWNGTIVDGHNRYEICTKHGIEFQVHEQEFGSRDDAKIWIIQNQFSRRNLNLAQLGFLALVLEPLIEARAKAKQIQSGKDCGKGAKGLLNSTNPLEPIHTREELAKIAGVGTDTIYKMKQIQDNATEEEKEALNEIESMYQKVAADQSTSTAQARTIIEKLNTWYDNLGDTLKWKTSTTDLKS